LQDEEINTIYFGGGTPSILPTPELKAIIDAVSNIFNVNAAAEVTLEANPDDLTLSKLVDLKAAGINRLSIGVQSFNDKTLRFLNRAHDGHTAHTSIHSARLAGFDNISIDLIYAIAGQSKEEWEQNIQSALSFAPEHFSAYSLTIENKTTFGNWASRGKLTLVEDDMAARQLDVLIEALAKEGYEQYEVSNFCKPGFQSKHNSNYWRQKKYLGIGPSAHSYNRISRQFNISNNHLYVKSLKNGEVPFEIEQLSREDHINEYLLTTLRTCWGADLSRLKDEFNYDLLLEHKRLIDDLTKRQLAIVNQNFLILTKKGLFHADKISSDLFLLS
jgi:oxygen-independent coproporphyrinogen-3 oxidase